MDLITYENLKKDLETSNINLPLIKGNLDIIYRMILREDFSIGKARQLKLKYGSRFYLEYYFFKNTVKSFKLPLSKFKKIKDYKADVLVFFTPYREDCEKFIYPVVNDLIAMNYKVTVVIPKIGAQRGFIASPKANFLIYEDFARNITFYVKAQYIYNKIVDKELWSWFKNNKIGDVKKNKIEIFFKKHVIDSLIALDILSLVKPKVIYAIHYILNPGYLQAINVYKKNHTAVNVLIQHGFFLSNYYGFHDFKGADIVILWGDYHKKILEQMADVPKNIQVIGNPKLEMSLKEINERKIFKTKEKAVLYISENSPKKNKKDQAAFEIFLEAIKDLTNVIVKVKLHPGETLQDYREYLDEKKITKEQFIFNQDLYHVLLPVDLVIGRFSTAMFEAMALNKPVVPIATKHDDLIWREIGLSSVSDVDELSELVNRLLRYHKDADELIKRQNLQLGLIFGDYTNSTKKIASFLSSIIDCKDGLEILQNSGI